MAGWTCPNCGTKNEAGLFNFCKKCGQTPPRTPTSSSAAGPTARQTTARPAPTVRTRTLAESSTIGASLRERSRRRRGPSFLRILITVAIIGLAVVLAANRLDFDTRDVDQLVSDIEGIGEPETQPQDAVVPADSEEATEADAEPTEEEPDAESEPPVTTTGPPVAPELDVADQGAVRCSRRWNAAVNAETRAAVVEAAAGERLWGGMQLARTGSSGVNGGPDLTGRCVLVVGVQPDPSRDALRALDVYAEIGPASGPRTAFRRLSTVSLSYAWNARMTNAALVRPKAAPADDPA